MAGASKRLIVALGGNAISAPDRRGTIAEQFAQTQRTAHLLGAAIVDGYQLIITHGNGPQVGNIMRRSEIARTELYPVPLEVCVADTQAGMGYMIAQCLMNDLVERAHVVVVLYVYRHGIHERDFPPRRVAHYAPFR